jgi:hypothetical protein
VPEIFDALLEMATNSPNEMVRLAAIRLALDHLVGKPVVAIDAVHTKLDVGQLYLDALRRANGVGQTIDGGNSINGSVGAASDPTEIQ